MSNKNFYIAEANVDDVNIITWNPELEQERKSAVFDLLNNGMFKILDREFTGPYKVNIKLIEWKLFLNIYDIYNSNFVEFKLSISSIRRIMRDYQIVCENYVEAIKTAPLKKIEAIDIGRRSIHDEGADTLKELLKENITLDMDTARRLFTLISIISIKI